MQMFGALKKPAKRFLCDFEVLGIARLHISLVEDVVPRDRSVLVARSSIDKPTIFIFSKAAEELEIVGRRAVVGES
ncbi:hypothetical protein EFR01_21220 [Sinorhizobium fredii]|nr:hypothetical protein EFR01_21220 [Sinorhizobium fredii]GLS07992.1 hypothetical protein GCM10007864_16200 [Sinorhizobium fredii]